MRIAFNPHKDRIHEASDHWYQVIVAVSLLNPVDYFKKVLSF